MTRARVATYALASLLFIVVAFPVYQMFLVSLLPQRAILDSAVIPRLSDLSFQNYVRAFSNGTISPHIYLNSVAVGLATALIGTFISALAGYSLARYRFFGSRVMDRFILLAYVIPPILLVVPIYVFMVGWQLEDTLVSVVLAHLILTIPFSVWLLRGFFRDIPVDLDEAARVDGASRLGVLWRIIVPDLAARARRGGCVHLPGVLERVPVLVRAHQLQGEPDLPGRALFGRRHVWRRPLGRDDGRRRGGHDARVRAVPAVPALARQRPHERRGQGMSEASWRQVGKEPRMSDTDIQQLETWYCRVTLETPIVLGDMVIAHRDFVIVRLRSAGGAEGVAYSLTRGAPLDLVLSELIGPRLMGRDALDTARRHEELTRGAVMLGAVGLVGRAISLVDIALWDLKGRLAGLPVWRLLGGYRQSAPVLLVAPYAGADETDDAYAERLAPLASRGYATIKLYPMADPEAMRRRLAVIRQRLGHGIGLVVDMAWSFRSAADAIAAVRSVGGVRPDLGGRPLPARRMALDPSAVRCGRDADRGG